MEISLRHLIRTCVLTSTLVGVASCGDGGNPAFGGGTPPPGPGLNFTVGGTIAGLAGSGLKIKNAGAAADLSITTNGAFTLPGSLANGTAYDVTVSAQPASPAQLCMVTNGKGTVNGNNVTNVAVTCSSTFPTEPDPSDPGQPTTLTLSSSSPADGATDVARNIAPALTFSADLNAATVTATSVSLRSANGEHPITPNVTGSQLTITSSHNLLPLTPYTLEVSNGLRGATGEMLATPATVSFTSADGEWQPSETRQIDPTIEGGDVRIAAGGNGLAIAAWSEEDAHGKTLVWVARYFPGQGWEDATQIDVLESFDPAVAMSPDGTARVAYIARSATGELHVWTRHRAASEPEWSNYTRLDDDGNDGTHNIFKLNVAITTQGESFAIWVDNRAGEPLNVQVNRGRADSWVGAEPIEHTDEDADFPRIAADANGNAMAVWSQSEVGGTHKRVFASRFSAGGDWSAPAPIDDPTQQDGFDAQIAIDANGNAVATWAQGDGMRQNIWWNRATGGVWGSADLVEQDDTNSTFDPQLAINGKGDAIVCWKKNETVAGVNISRLSANVYLHGSWDGMRMITGDDVSADDSRVAIDASGNALVVAGVLVGIQFPIATYRFTPSDKWSNGIPLSQHGEGAAVVIDADGNALAAWSDLDGTDGQIRTSRFE